MPGAASSRRFAQAVFQIALENNALDTWMDDLTLLANAIVNREFVDFVDAPEIPTDRKLAVIQETLKDSLSPLALNFISLLATRSISYVLPDVVTQFELLLNEHRGIEHAEVVTAVSLSDEQEQRVSQLLKDMVGKDIRLTTRVDPQILGGLVARVGDKVIDGSTRTRLSAMRLNIVEQLT